jgi:hypothetical protein
MRQQNTRIKRLAQLRKGWIPVLLALFLAVCLLLTSSCCTKALPPKLYVGDQWIYKQTYEGVDYTRTETITGEERIQDKDCYVVKVIFTPTFLGWVPEWTEWRDKKTYSKVQMQFSASHIDVPDIVNRSEVYSSQLTGSEWSYRVATNLR